MSAFITTWFYAANTIMPVVTTRVVVLDLVIKEIIFSFTSLASPHPVKAN